MSQVQLSVMGEKEVSDLLATTQALIAALVAKKPVLQILAEEFGALNQAVSDVQALPADFKQDPFGCAASALVGGLSIVQAAMTKPAA